jgi:hypothetical protein
MNWSTVIWNNGIEKVISTTQITLPTFVDSRGAGRVTSNSPGALTLNYIREDFYIADRLLV